jgi:hypothetical protein
MSQQGTLKSAAFTYALSPHVALYKAVVLRELSASTDQH